MQQVSKLSLQPECSYISTVDAATRAMYVLVEDAKRLAQTGEWLSARQCCAELITVYQPRLAREPGLLANTISALLCARGFQALTRLLIATRGRKVRFVLEPRHEASLATSIVGEDGIEQISISAPWLADASAVQQWSDLMVATIRPALAELV